MNAASPASMQDGGALEPSRCVLIGSEPLLAQSAAMLLERGHSLAAIVTRRPAIRDWAHANAVPIIPDLAALQGAELGTFDYLFSITNLAILPPAILALPRVASINFHDGPLPETAGLNTPVWALLSGKARHGVTWHLMEERIDTGAVLAARSFDIDPEESAHSINTKCFAAAIESFGELIDNLPAGVRKPLRPATEPLTYYGRERRPAAAATLGWDQDAAALAALVRHLDFGGHANPLAMPKFRVGSDIVLVTGARARPSSVVAPPGAITRADADGIWIATGSGDLQLTALMTAGGVALTPVEAALKFGLRHGTVLANEPTDRAALISSLDAAVALYEPWWRARWASCDPLALPTANVTGPAEDRPAGTADTVVAGDAPASTVLAALIGYFARLGDRSRFDIAYWDPIFAARFDDVEPWFANRLPLTAHVDFEHGLIDLAGRVGCAVRDMHRRVGHSADLLARHPDLIALAHLPVAFVVSDELDSAASLPGAALTVTIQGDGRAMRWHHAAGLDDAEIAALQSGFAVMLAAALAAPDRAIGELPLMPERDVAGLLKHSRGPEPDDFDEACIHEQFVSQVARTPEAPAATGHGVTLSYAELDRRSNRLANHLRTCAVGPGTLVGIHLDRSVELLVAIIAIHKAGGAYVPLDPAYPAERVAHMVRDSGMSVIVTQDRHAAQLPATDATRIHIDRDAAAIAASSDEAPIGGASPHDLAYVIYTSGSTGLPKGVMVEHRNVANFFAGMDAVIAPGGTWLAVTSLSFDISVLELCWTVARGCHVVITSGDALKHAGEAAARPTQFSLFYFASADSGAASDRYRLLLDGARFADTHGFAAIWTPERHFHAFGGLYPNPSVTSAAVAAVTSRIAIRGGSVVLPLHHPARVAEEWSLVDNLSGGRVGIAFASGWQPNDFLLRPENFADKTTALMNGIDAVRGLWRGETRAFPGPRGDPVEVAIFPRPVQPELPFWITSAGNPDTFAAAGRAGAFILTHLLGQTVAELGAKIEAYRAAWREAGHAGEGHVTLMLHSFVGEDEAMVRAAVRQPLTDYLRTSTDLIKEFAASFPAFKSRPGAMLPDLATLSDEEMSGLLDHAFERYFEHGGLFGNTERCLAMVESVSAVGVDEIGCLIDFGVPVQTVLDHLPDLDALRLATAARAATTGETPGALMKRHRVTHLQCTPSMAQMLSSDAESREGLRELQQMMVGGEAFPPALATELVGLVGGSVHNMYGPTETTIWSTTQQIGDTASAIPLGRPLAHQQVYVLDCRGQLAPPDIAGELVIAGKGVTRGYLDRAELTAERFIAHPVDAEGRAYRTGDLARRRRDGTLEFLGRGDHQVKIRGHRIELGEIEAALGRHPDVERAIVTAREDVPGDVRVVAYYVAERQTMPTVAALSDFLKAQLPEPMLPAHLIALPALPRTPNGKIDRAALPRPDIGTVAPKVAMTPPEGELEAVIATVWREVLNVPEVGRRDNFFDLGGHSLLAVQVHRRLREATGTPLPLTDIFRFPTIRALAAHLDAGTPIDRDQSVTPGRAAGRRAALARRLGHPAMPARENA